MMRMRTTRSTKSPKRKAKSQNDSSGVVFSVVAVVVIFGSLLGTVIVQTFIVQNRVQLDAVLADVEIERERNQQLRLEVIELEAPERILDTAVSRLGMVRPAERTYLPGLDPALVEIAPPRVADPFGPGVLPDYLTAEIAQASDSDEDAQ